MDSRGDFTMWELALLLLKPKWMLLSPQSSVLCTPKGWRFVGHLPPGEFSFHREPLALFSRPRAPPPSGSQPVQKGKIVTDFSVKEKSLRIRLWGEGCHKVTSLIKPLQFLGCFKYRQFECIIEPRPMFPLLCSEPDWEQKTAGVVYCDSGARFSMSLWSPSKCVKQFLLWAWTRREGWEPLKCQVQRPTPSVALWLPADPQYSQVQCPTHSTAENATKCAWEKYSLGKKRFQASVLRLERGN